MKTIFDEVSSKCSKLTTKAYSTSFSMGIYFINKRLRNHIYAIYGFVRFADEIVDSFDGYDKKELLSKFRCETYEAITSGISLNPILNSFQLTVNKYNIELSKIETFLKSMEMDLEKIKYSKDEYKEYILGSAEVVGLMCLQVFTEGDKKLYEELKPYAMKLGSVFQKINFLRDIKQDQLVLGRTYFPNVNLNEFTAECKEEIECEIDTEFKEALKGIKKLPSSSRGGVYLAYLYYTSLFDKIRKLSSQKILNERIRVNNFEKFYLMINSLFHTKLNMIS